MPQVALLDLGWLLLVGLVWCVAGRLRPLCALAAAWVIIEIVAHGAMETAVARLFARL
jgi:hypothetical protein